MEGKQIYFTEQEIRILSLVLQEWEDMLMTKDEITVFQHRLKHGLGTAWKKIEETNKELN